MACRATIAAPRPACAYRKSKPERSDDEVHQARGVSVLHGLHESEIRCGIQNDPPAGGITAWIDYGSRTEKATFYGTIVGDRQVWQATDRIPAWLHVTALRLFPDSPYAKAHGG
jgi:hypothetical protein